MSRCYAYIVAYISRLEIGNVVLRPARLEVRHYDKFRPHGKPIKEIKALAQECLGGGERQAATT